MLLIIVAWVNHPNMKPSHLLLEQQASTWAEQFSRAYAKKRTSVEDYWEKLANGAKGACIIFPVIDLRSSICFYSALDMRI